LECLSSKRVSRFLGSSLPAYTYIYIYIYTYTHIYIHIYIEREREISRGRLGAVRDVAPLIAFPFSRFITPGTGVDPTNVFRDGDGSSTDASRKHYREQKTGRQDLQERNLIKVRPAYS